MKYLVQASWPKTVVDPSWDFVDQKNHKHNAKSASKTLHRTIRYRTKYLCDGPITVEVVKYYCRKCQEPITVPFIDQPHTYWICDEIFSSTQSGEQESMYGHFAGHIVGYKESRNDG